MSLNDPIPSQAFDVLEENMRVADEIVNGLNQTANNRPAPNGHAVTKTFYGMELEFDALVDGFETAGDQALIDIAADVSEVDDTKDTALIDIDADVAEVDAAVPFATTAIDADVLVVDNAKNQALIDIDADVAEVDAATSDALIQIQADLDSVAAEVGNIDQSVLDAEAAALAAEQSASESAASALVSASNANFKGKWSLLTGSAIVPYSANDDTGDGNNYQLLEDIPDITLSQPSLNPAQWKLIISPALTEPVASLPMGATIVERLSGPLSSSRAGDTGNVNITGASETLPADAYSITARGLSAFEAYLNNLLWTQNLSVASSWSKSGVSIVQGALSPKGDLTGSTITEVTASGSRKVTQSIAAIPSVPYTFGVFVKAGTITSFLLQLATQPTTISATLNINALTGVISNVGVDVVSYDSEKVAFGYWFVWLTVNTLPDTATLISQVYVAAGDGTQSGIAWGAQTTQTDFPAPYSVNEATTNIRPSDLVTARVMNNLPAPGLPVSILVDYVFFNTATPKFLFEVTDRLGVYAAGSELIARYKDDASFFTLQYGSPIADGDRRVGITFEDSILRMYVDGVLGGSVVVSDLQYDVNEDIYIGTNEDGDQNANSEVAKWKSFDVALSSEEMASRGGVK